jgi:hypothetical protein
MIYPGQAVLKNCASMAGGSFIGGTSSGVFSGAGGSFTGGGTSGGAPGGFLSGFVFSVNACISLLLFKKFVVFQQPGVMAKNRKILLHSNLFSHYFA